MKAVDFNLQKEINFDFDKGITSFKSNRLLIFDADSMGLLRQNLINMLGILQAKKFFLKFGYQKGFADFLQTKIYYDFDSDIELLHTGPVLHTWEGIVKAVPNEIVLDREKGIFNYTGTWINSYEAEQHLAYNQLSEDPVCWTLMGYASGWCTAFWGEPVIANETQCAGMGADDCKWLIKPLNECGGEVKSHISAFKEFWGEK